VFEGLVYIFTKYNIKDKMKNAIFKMKNKIMSCTLLLTSPFHHPLSSQSLLWIITKSPSLSSSSSGCRAEYGKRTRAVSLRGLGGSSGAISDETVSGFVAKPFTWVTVLGAGSSIITKLEGKTPIYYVK